MGRLTVTRTKVSREPYCMKESGQHLYSYEELCYYIRSRIPLWLEEETRDGLTDKMTEWGLDITEIDRLSPREAAKAIFDAGTYLKREEKDQILEQMGQYTESEQIYSEKEKGDLYLFYGKNRKAYLAYWNAITLLTEQEDAAWKASLYHNMGIVCCRFFYWKEAKKCFALALDARDSRESRIGLELVLDLEKKSWKSDGMPADESKLQFRKQEFLNECV